MKNKNILVLLPIIIAIALVVGVFIGQKMTLVSHTSGFSTANDSQTNKLNQVINFIKSDYVDTVQESWIVEETINGILQNLDPHSYYIPGERYNEVNDPLEGEFEGIGIEFRIQDDTVVVVKPIPGGPSENMGVMAGDRIVEVEKENITGESINNSKVMKLLKGKKGTFVNVGMKRPGVEKLIDFKIKRDKIPIFSIESAYMIDDSIGYIKIIRFARTTFDEFIEATNKLKREGMTKIVLDLRNNGGGYMRAATDLADEFLKKGELIVYTEGNARARQDVYATSSGNFENTDVVVLINEGSASASEILAGALQDNDRGLIIGRRSFGKGLVQEPMQWSDGSQVRLTVARYYTPTGRSIQKPYEESTEVYNDDYLNRYDSGELFSADSIKFPDSLKYYTKLGKLVYGGGGIMPDVFIPIDTNGGSNFYARLNYSGLFYLFGFEYTDKNRDNLDASLDAVSFAKEYEISKELLNEFYEFTADKGLEFDKIGAEESQEVIKNRIKASIGRNLFGNNVFYQVLNKADSTLKESISLIKKRS